MGKIWTAVISDLKESFALVRRGVFHESLSFCYDLAVNEKSKD